MQGLPLYVKCGSTLTFSLTYCDAFISLHSVPTHTSAIGEATIPSTGSLIPSLRPRIVAHVALSPDTADGQHVYAERLPVVIVDAAASFGNKHVSVSVGPVPAELSQGAHVILRCQIAGRTVEGFPCRIGVVKAVCLAARGPT
jgi:hypothetical protein